MIQEIGDVFRRIVSGIMLSLLLTSMLTLTFNILPVKTDESNYSWSTFKHDLQRTGYSPSTAPKEAAIAWVSAPVGIVNEPQTMSPSIVDGKVFVASWQGYVYALSELDGTILWSHRTESNFISAPTVSSEMVLVASLDGYVYSLDQDSGVLIWEYQTGEEISSTPAVSEDRVFFTTTTLGFLYCLSAQNGQLIWKTQIGSSMSSPALDSNMVFVASASAIVHALNAITGAPIWEYNEATLDSGGTVVVSNGRVIVLSQMQRVRVLDEFSGTLLWRKDLFEGSGGTFQSPAVAYGTIFVATTDGRVVALDEASGNEKWSTKIGWLMISSPAVADSVVFATSYQTVSVDTYCGNLTALDAFTGSLVWSYKTPYLGGWSSPSIAEGILFLGYDHGVYAFGPQVSTVPKITSIDPSQPIASGGRQWLTILGEGFAADSEVTLSYGSSVYPIPTDRTWFIDSDKMEVLAGVSEGLWQVWVTNLGNIQSSRYAFQVRSFSADDCGKVAALALQYWTPKDAAIMAAIAAAESGLNPNVGGDYGISDFNCGGYASWGLWQVYMKMHLDKLEKLGAPIDDPYKTAKWLSNPNNNARAAYKVWEEAYRAWGNGFLPWSTYKNGRYKTYLGMFEKRVSIFKCPVNITIIDDYGRIISEVENQIPGASFEYFEMTSAKVFYLPLNLTYIVQLEATSSGNCTIGQITPTESVYKTAFSQVTFNLTSETVAQFDLLPSSANYTLKVDENGDGSLDYLLTPGTEILDIEYDVGINGTISMKAVVGRGYDLPINISLMNCGAYEESFNFTVHTNTTMIALQVVTLASGNSTTLTYAWNTTGLAYGNYTISACAEPVLNETYVADNNVTCTVHVGVPGDISGPTQGVYDRTVNMRDVQYMILLFNTDPGSPNWKPNADVNNDGTVNMRDIQIAILNFNKHE